MKGHLICAYIGLFLLSFDVTTTVLNFSALNVSSTCIAFMIVVHHTLHYKELKDLKQSREETANVVTVANDVLAPLNKQFLVSPKDFQYHLVSGRAPRTQL